MLCKGTLFLALSSVVYAIDDALVKNADYETVQSLNAG